VVGYLCICAGVSCAGLGGGEGGLLWWFDFLVLRDCCIGFWGFV